MRGLSQSTLKIIEAASGILAAIQPATVRTVCYRLFSAKLIGSMAKNETNRVSKILVTAREKNMIDWDWIVDETRQIERKPQWGDVQEFVGDVKRQYAKDYWLNSNNRIIIVSEKSTVGGVLRPVMNEYGVEFLSVHGFNSATKMWELAQSSAYDDRDLILLYVGDFDPSGMWMSARDLPERMREYGGEFKLERLALTTSDVRSDDPTTFKAEDKTKDPRFKWFVANYGGTCRELDALDPNELRDRVTSRIRGYIDQDAWERYKATEKAEIETLEKVFEKWPEQIEASLKMPEMEHQTPSWWLDLSA
jgi:hypothetical protein